MWCNNYINISFLDHGRSKEGCDCWGLARIIYKEQLDIDLPLLLDYKDTKDGFSISNLYKEQRPKWIEISKGQEQPYDILVFKI